MWRTQRLGVRAAIFPAVGVFFSRIKPYVRSIKPHVVFSRIDAPRRFQDQSVFAHPHRTPQKIPCLKPLTQTFLGADPTLQAVRA